MYTRSGASWDLVRVRVRDRVLDDLFVVRATQGTQWEAPDVAPSVKSLSTAIECYTGPVLEHIETDGALH